MHSPLPCAQLCLQQPYCKICTCLAERLRGKGYSGTWGRGEDPWWVSMGPCLAGGGGDRLLEAEQVLSPSDGCRAGGCCSHWHHSHGHVGGAGHPAARAAVQRALAVDFDLPDGSLCLWDLEQMREGQAVAFPWAPGGAQARGAGGDPCGRPLRPEPRKMAERGARLKRGGGRQRLWRCNSESRC